MHATTATDQNISISVGGGIGCRIGLVGCLKTNMGNNNIREKKLSYAFKYQLLQHFYLCSDLT